jgi:hypothetical protein
VGSFTYNVEDPIMTRLLIAFSCLIPSRAFPHIGFLGELAAALAAAAVASFKGRDEGASLEDEPELQEA